MIKEPGPHASISAACSSGSGVCAPRAPCISILCLVCRPRITAAVCMLLRAIALRSMSRLLLELVQMPCPAARLHSNPAHGSHLELNHRSQNLCSEPRQTWAPPRWSCHHGAQGGPMALRATHTSCCCCGTWMLMDVELNRLDTLRWHCRELARCSVSAPLRSPAPVCAPRSGFLIIRSVAGLQPARRRRASRPQSAPCAAVPTGLRFAC